MPEKAPARCLARDKREFFLVGWSQNKKSPSTGVEGQHSQTGWEKWIRPNSVAVRSVVEGSARLGAGLGS